MEDAQHVAVTPVQASSPDASLTFQLQRRESMHVVETRSIFFRLVLFPEVVLEACRTVEKAGEADSRLTI